MRFRNPATSSSQGKSSQLQPVLAENPAGVNTMAGGAPTFAMGVRVSSPSVGVMVGVKSGVSVAVGVAVAASVGVSVAVGVMLGVLLGAGVSDATGVLV